MGVNDMDIVEFVEKVCEFSLTDFQKEFVRKVMQKNMYFYSFSISKCILNRSLRWVLELIVLVLLTEEV